MNSLGGLSEKSLISKSSLACFLTCNGKDVRAGPLMTKKQNKTKHLSEKNLMQWRPGYLERWLRVLCSKLDTQSSQLQQSDSVSCSSLLYQSSPFVPHRVSLEFQGHPKENQKREQNNHSEWLSSLLTVLVPKLNPAFQSNCCSNIWQSSMFLEQARAAQISVHVYAHFLW